MSGDDGLEPRDGPPFALGGFVGRGALVGVGADSFGPYGVPPIPEVRHGLFMLFMLLARSTLQNPLFMLFMQ